MTILVSCQEDKLDVDVSTVKVEVNLQRLDQDWKNISPVVFRKTHPVYEAEYPEVYKHYIEDVMRFGTLGDSNLYMHIKEFLAHPDFEQVFLEVQNVYPNREALQAKLTSAWQHYRYYFPEANIPNHLTCVCGFNNPLIVTENGIGLCLEMFLGSDCRFYEYLHTPFYLRQRMTPKHLVPWMMKGWLETEFVDTLDRPSLLDEIVQAGKVFYCMDALFPHTPDSIKIGYTALQIKWAEEHERFVWAHFVDNQLLFETDPNTVGKFTSDGPFTVDLVKESPSRMGHYVGWQMVREYMDDQDAVNLNRLMETSAQEILNKSKYKP